MPRKLLLDEIQINLKKTLENTEFKFKFTMNYQITNHLLLEVKLEDVSESGNAAMSNVLSRDQLALAHFRAMNRRLLPLLASGYPIRNQKKYQHHVHITRNRFHAFLVHQDRYLLAEILLTEFLKFKNFLNFISFIFEEKKIKKNY